MRTSLPLRALLALLAAAPLPALADNTADEADVAFALGNRAYAKRQYAEALGQYFLSQRLVPNRNVLFNIARCYEALGRFDEAYRYYHDLSREKLADDDAREVQRAMARIRPRVALLDVRTEPPGADVYVDREDLGSRGLSPQVLAVPPGRHTVLAKLEGYHLAKAEVALERGETTTRKLELRAILGYVELTGGPEGAEVRDAVSGPVLGKVPGKLALPVGRRLLYVTAPGFAPSQYPVELTADEHLTVRVGLTAAAGPSGKIIITANRPNARVKVDGREAGFTPTVLTVPQGEHEVELSSPEMRAFHRKVTVQKDSEVQVYAELRYAPPPVRAASKSLLALEEAPASVSVITADEIRSFGYTTLPEALEAVRGVFSSDNRDYEFLGIRGFSPEGDLNTRILILWDGHPMNDVWAGQGYSGRDLTMDLSEVDRIEVVRGPGSALYGTSALFAVINVVPRNALGEGRHFELQGGVGGQRAFGAHGAVAAEGPLGMRAILSASALNAQGAEITDLGSMGTVVGLDGERGYGANARLTWGGLTASAYFNARAKDIPTAPYNTVVGGAGTGTTDSRGFAELRYEGEVPFGAISARAYYDASRYVGHWAYDDGGGGIQIESDDGLADWMGGEARARLGLFGSSNQLTIGAEAQRQFRVEHAYYPVGGGKEPLPSKGRTMLSAYLLDDWALHPRLYLSLGVRVDKYLDLDVIPITPRAALIAKPYDGGVTKLVAGQAFRAPNVLELFNHDFGESMIPPDSLEPETITTVELEHAHEVSSEMRVTLSGYWSRIENLIYLNQRQDMPPQCGAPGAEVQCLQYANDQTPRQAFGGEAEVRWQAGRFAMMDLAYSYVYLDSDTQEITATPAHILSARVLFPLAETGARIAVQAKYQSSRAVEGGTRAGEAFLLNCGISGDAGTFRYFAGVRNILDAHYGIPFGPEYGAPVLPQHGREFWVQLTATY